MAFDDEADQGRGELTACAAVHESAHGPFRTSGDVRSSVANGGKPDMARRAQFGSRMTQSGRRVQNRLTALV